MRLSMALLAVAPACGFSSGSNPTIDASPGSDADTDVTVVVDAPDAAIPPDAAPVCYGTIARVCFNTPPTGAFVASQPAIDTKTSAMCNPNHDRADLYCVIAGASVTIPAGVTLRAFGDKPLVLISTTTMLDVAGVIDVSSRAGINVGAGGNSDACPAGNPATGTSGGFGGSFGGKGGTGKSIDPDGGGVSGAPSAGFPTTLRGGCKGGLGAGDPTGTGGNGGGAVVLVAPEVVIAGQINASGAGGHGGGSRKCGGGGGGSGGMIVIESPAISLLAGAGAIFANGGGGGQGGEGKGNGEGGDGKESTGPAIDGTGGTGDAGGGDGANGASGTSILDGDSAGASASGNGGGGGGGGASGFIRAPGATGGIAPPSNPP